VSGVGEEKESRMRDWITALSLLTTALIAAPAMAQERPWEWGMHPGWWMWGAGGMVMVLMMLVFWGLVIAALVLVVGAVSTGFAIAAAGGDEQPLTGSDLEQAKAAALAHTGGGTVTETETGDDGAAYSVEVRLADGTQVEVNLDGNFDVIGQATDDDGPGDQEGPGDDD